MKRQKSGFFFESDKLTSVILSGTRGEYESFAISLKGSYVGTLDVFVDDLKNVKSDLIPKSAIEIRVLEFAKIPRSKQKDWIVREGVAKSVSKTNKPIQFWITIQIPSNTKEGVYFGDITFKAEGHVGTLPIEIEVLPFALDEPDIHFYLLSTNSPYGKNYRNLKNPEQLTPAVIDFYKDLKAHGMTGAAIKSADFPYKQGDISGLIAELEAVQKAGLSGPVLWNMKALVNAAIRRGSLQLQWTDGFLGGR